MGELRCPSRRFYVEGLAPLLRLHNNSSKSETHLFTLITGLQGLSDCPGFRVPSWSLSAKQKELLYKCDTRNHRVNPLSSRPGSQVARQAPIRTCLFIKIKYQLITKALRILENF